MRVNYQRIIELSNKLIGDFTSADMEFLFGINVDVADTNFQKRINHIWNNTIREVDPMKIIYENPNLDPTESYMLGCIIRMQKNMPENKVIVLTGDSLSGKSHILKLIERLKQMDINNSEEVKKLDFRSQNPIELQELKKLVNYITIIRKKTTRPKRESEINRPEIEAGLSRKEVEGRDLTYERFGSLYGFDTDDIDDALIKGHAILIATDESAVKKLVNRYPSQVLMIFVFRTGNKEEWKQLANEDHRPSQEIELRETRMMETFYGQYMKIVKEAKNKMSVNVLLNPKDIQFSEDALLFQLRNCIDCAYQEGELKRQEEVR